MLAVAGAIGAQARVPAMVLMRAPLGERGSYLPTAINVVQCVGWTVFELLVIATAAAALSDEVLGFEARWAWTLVFGAAALAMGLLGPIGVVRTLSAASPSGSSRSRSPTSAGGRSRAADSRTRGTGPARAACRRGRGSTSSSASRSRGSRSRPTTRGSRARHAARSGARASGTSLPDALLLALGAVVLLTRDVADAAALPAAVAAGGLVALLALLALTVAETDEAFANAYSGAVSLQNLLPSVSQRLLVVATTTAGTIGALALELTSFQSFLFLLGSCFVPLFAVLLADWLAAGRRYELDDVFAAPSVRAGAIVAWLAGFAAYQWLSPTGPVWWVDQVERLDPPAWGIGATLPSFVVSFGLMALVAGVDRARAGSLSPRG